MKYLKLLACTFAFIFLQPSFACGCGDEFSNGGISGIIVLGLVVFSFFIPLIYALAKFKAYRLSAKILFTPYILSFAIIGGLYILVEKFGSNIPIPMIHKTVSIDTIAIISCILIFLSLYTTKKDNSLK